MHRSRLFLRVFITIIIASLLLGGLSITPAANAVAARSVIVQSDTAEAAAQLVERFGGEVTSTLSIINGVGALLTPDAAAALDAMDGVRVTANAPAQLTKHSFEPVAKNGKGVETDYPDVTGADLVWNEGVTGQGVTVAVVDTGIANHPDLKKKSQGNGNSPVIGWVDFVDGKKNPTDPNGHGTHIAGIIANATVGADGEYLGMAPGVDLVGVRVLDETGAGYYEDVIQGIQWVVENKDRYNIKVMNLSLHALVQSPYWADPLNQAVMRAWAEGITVVVAAGNSGPNPMSISVPGNNPYVITVGSFTDSYTVNDWTDDTIAEFSAAGPTLDGFVKPDLVAPGAHIVSTMNPGSYIARNHDANRIEAQYFSMAGTSQSAAVVSGVAALALSNNPDLTPNELKHRLMFTALPWITLDETDVLYSVWQQGAGRLNAYDAVLATDIEGSANLNMDIAADLAGEMHYEGYSYFDEETGKFLLRGYEDMTSGFGAWSGGFGAWSGGFGAWSGSLGAWSGGFGAWSGSLGAWSGSLGAWSGSLGAWSGSLGAWSGGFGAWSGSLGAWSGSLGAWSGSLTDQTFVENFINGVSPSIDTTSASINWVEE